MINFNNIFVPSFVNNFNNVINEIKAETGVDKLQLQAYCTFPKIGTIKKLYDVFEYDLVFGQLLTENQLEVVSRENGRLVTHDIFIAYNVFKNKFLWSYGQVDY